MIDEKIFSEYESHIDSIIIQYKNQLENIKNNRFNSNSNFNKCNEKINNRVENKIDNKVENKNECLSSSFSKIDEPLSYFKKNSEDKLHNNSTSIKVNTSTLSEDNNVFLLQKINELTKELEIKEDYKLKYENLLVELNKFSSTESLWIKEKQQLELKIRNYEIQLEEKNEYLEKRTEEIEKYFESQFKNKLEEIEFLNTKIDEITEENNLIREKFNSIFRKHIDILKFELSNRYNDSNISTCLDSIDNFINKILQDNKDLVNHLNKVMNRNENLDECVRVRKLNEVIDDLRIENSLLKSQLNNLTNELKTVKKDIGVERRKSKKSVIRTKKRDSSNSDAEITNISKKKKQNLDQNTSSSNSNIRPNNHNSNSVNMIPKVTNTAVINDFKFNLNNQNVNSNTCNEIGSDFFQLEKLKNKIKVLESKIGEINKDDKEKKIIDSLREFRYRNISPHNKND